MCYQGLHQAGRVVHVAHRKTKIIARGSDKVGSKHDRKSGRGHMVVLFEVSHPEAPSALFATQALCGVPYLSRCSMRRLSSV